MKSLLLTLTLGCFAVFSPVHFGQPPSARKDVSRSAVVQPFAVGKTGVVVDETLSVLRKTPSLFGEPIHRMRSGRKVRILAVREADGVRFFRVVAPPSSAGWVQADAIFGEFRDGDDARMTRLISAMTGFEQLETALLFPELFPKSPLLPKILLLIGDLADDAAIKLSRDAASRLKRHQMAATGAPLHSYFLNFVSLDRYRKVGIVFLFNPEKKKFYYEGAKWRQVIALAPNSDEAAEARKRLETLKKNMETTGEDNSAAGSTNN